MAKPQSSHKCTLCGHVSKKWSGKCTGCGEWDSLIEVDRSGRPPSSKLDALTARPTPLTDLASKSESPPRLQIGVDELDRVFGGGVVYASATLIGGDPGIGKSTLLLQAAARLARQGKSVMYVSGEESAAQIQDRAGRLKLSESPVKLAIETDAARIIATLEVEKPDFVVIDSIQTLWSGEIASAPGSVSQVRACCQELVRWAKTSGTAIVLVGHVTKEGQIAGPRVVEHLVDTVLYFEGDRNHIFRILRAKKNRYGPIDEIGLFEMHRYGLAPAADPSRLFVTDAGSGEAGVSIFPTMEGTRTVLVEIQALVAKSGQGQARRAVVGWDSQRLSMVLAVLQTQCGLDLSTADIYLTVTGGFKLSDPAADLAAAAALVSAFQQTALPKKSIFIGEIGLSGRVRTPPHLEARLKEAQKLGYDTAYISKNSTHIKTDLTLHPITRLSEFIENCFQT